MIDWGKIRRWGLAIGALVVGGCDAHRLASAAPDGERIVVEDLDAGPGPAAPDARGGKAPVSSADAGVDREGNSCRGQWRCDGTRCVLVGAARAGLPSSSGSWQCHYRIAVPEERDSWTCGGSGAWLCYGHLPAEAASPGGCGWSCERILSWREDRVFYRCSRPADDLPPGMLPLPTCQCVNGARCVACEKSSFVGGTVCHVVADSVTRVPRIAVVYGGGSCEPGARYWCDVPQYSSWGQVTCQPDGTWPTTTVNGKKMLDCQERADGKRPATVCACYHFYANFSCCERLDCRVPAGTDGWHCPPSAGRPCDYCSPQKPECKAGICAVANTMETFCAADCGPSGACPAGTRCMRVKRKGSERPVCIPEDFGCYW